MSETQEHTTPPPVPGTPREAPHGEKPGARESGKVLANGFDAYEALYLAEDYASLTAAQLKGRLLEFVGRYLIHLRARKSLAEEEDAEPRPAQSFSETGALAAYHESLSGHRRRLVARRAAVREAYIELLAYSFLCSFVPTKSEVVLEVGAGPAPVGSPSGGSSSTASKGGVEVSTGVIDAGTYLIKRSSDVPMDRHCVSGASGEERPALAELARRIVALPEFSGRTLIDGVREHKEAHPETASADDGSATTEAAAETSPGERRGESQRNRDERHGMEPISIPSLSVERVRQGSRPGGPRQGDSRRGDSRQGMPSPGEHLGSVSQQPPAESPAERRPAASGTLRGGASPAEAPTDEDSSRRDGSPRRRVTRPTEPGSG